MRARANSDSRQPHAADTFGRAQLVIGWSEFVDLPEWNICHLKAKIDTGARTSAIHVDDIQLLPHDRVRFDVITEINHRTHQMKRVRIEAPLVRTARIRPSHGVEQQRPVVSTLLQLGPIERRIELSLVCRKRMRFRLLLGRLAIKGLLINPTHGFLLPHPPPPEHSNGAGSKASTTTTTTKHFRSHERSADRAGNHRSNRGGSR
jgi:hypothetical protein